MVLLKFSTYWESNTNLHLAYFYYFTNHHLLKVSAGQHMHPALPTHTFIHVRLCRDIIDAFLLKLEPIISRGTTQEDTLVMLVRESL